MREGIARALRFHDSSISMRFESLPSGSRPRPREIARLVSAIRQSDAIVLAGGSHFHDRYGRRSLRILAMHWLMFRTARVLGARVGYAAIGVGPFSTRIGRWLGGRALSAAHTVLVRDQRSAFTAEELGARGVLLGFDSAALLPRPRAQTALARNNVGVSLIPYFSVFENDRSLDHKVVERLASVLKECLQPKDIEVEVLALNRAGFISDLGISNALIASLPSVATALTLQSDPAEALNQVADLGGLIATRYHAAVLGYLAELPLIVIAYDEKCIALADEIRLPAEAVLQPSELLEGERLGLVVRGLVEKPDDFKAALPIGDAVLRAELGLANFARAIS